MRLRFKGALIAACAALLSTSVIAPAIADAPVPVAEATEVTAATAPVALDFDFDRHGLPDTMQGGNILHAWNMTFRDIEANLPAIAAAGFGVIQTSPIGESMITPPDFDYYRDEPGGNRHIESPWWVLYQPTAFRIGNILGSEAEFRSLTQAAAAHGIHVIVDAVPNHTSAYFHLLDDELRGRHDWFRAVPGRGGWYDQNIGDYRGGADWGDRYATTRLRLLGLVDFDTGNPSFQQRYFQFLGEKIAAGASGFRYDAMVHIELPCPFDGPYMCSDFWPNAQRFVEQRVSEMHGIDTFQYGELLHRLHNTYLDAIPGMHVTADNYGYWLRDQMLRNGNISSWDVNWGQPQNESSPLGRHRAERLVPWVESHDHFGNAGVSNWISDAQFRVGWGLIAARADTTPLWLVRPGQDAMLPNGNFNNNGNMFSENADGTWRNNWGHDRFFEDPTIVAINWFSNHFNGQPERTSTHGQVAMIERGASPQQTDGVVIVNAGTNWTRVDFPVNLPDGTVTDQVSGNEFTVAGGRISGHYLAPRSVIVAYHPDTAIVARPGVAAEPGTSTFHDEAGVAVTLSAFNATAASYAVSLRGEVVAAGSYAHGDVITIGADAEIGDDFVLRLEATDGEDTATGEFTFTRVEAPGPIRIEFTHPSWAAPRIWAWNAAGNQTGGNWNSAPLMTREVADDGVEVWVHTFAPDVEAPLQVMFHNGAGQQVPPSDGWRVEGSARVTHTGEVTPIVVTPGPVVYITGGVANFDNASGIDVTLRAQRTTEQSFTVTRDGEEIAAGAFAPGEVLNVGAGAAPGEVFVLTVTGTDGNRVDTRSFQFVRVDSQAPLRIEFTHPSWEAPRLWAWTAEANLVGGDWDNAPLMTRETAADGTEVWVHTLPAGTSVPVSVIVHNGDGEQLPPLNQGGWLLTTSSRITHTGEIDRIDPVFGEPRLWITPDVTEFTGEQGLQVRMHGENMRTMQFQYRGMPMLADFVNGQTQTVGVGIPVDSEVYLRLVGVALNGENVSADFTFTRIAGDDDDGPVNLLLNPSFEYPDMSMWLVESAQGLPTDAPGGSGLGRGQTMPLTGAYSLRFWHDQNSYFNIRQYVDIPESGTYDFSAWFQGVSGPAWAGHAYPFISLDGTLVGGGSTYRVDLPGGNNWRELAVSEVELEAGDRVVVGVQAYLPPNSWGSFDDFSLVLVEAASPVMCEYAGLEHLYADDPLCVYTPPPYVELDSVAISGAAVFGQTLTATVTGLDPADAAVEFEWLRGTEVIGTAREFALTDASLVGVEIVVRATATADGFLPVTVSSAPVTIAAATFTGSVAITGTAEVGSTLSAVSEFAPATGVVTYQWYADGAPIAGATAALLDLSADLVGAVITVAATSSSAGFETLTVTSAATVPVALPPARCAYEGLEHLYADDPLCVYPGDGTEPGFAADRLAIRRGNQFFKSFDLVGGNADINFTFGRVGDEVFMGDWNGNGIDTPAIRRGNQFYLTNHQQGGWADTVFTFGRVGDEVFVGDWNGNGVDSFAIRRGNQIFVSNSFVSGPAAEVFAFGRATDELLPGNFDGEPGDTFAVRRGNEIFVNNTLRGGNADYSFTFGRASDDVFVGDWNGSGYDTWSLRRGNEFFKSYSPTANTIDHRFTFGRLGDEVFVGHWGTN